ncbi:MAG: tRNA epoxyqueuosine(34) reductase QueG [Gemmatimonadaceae bacterium]|nr:tRNA epoxyqueuosine(34) reductase QueG [Gemmatimonadaceae bacterium]
MPVDERRALTERLRAHAYGLGFDLVGITTLGAPGTLDAYDAWLDAGYHGTMQYMAGDGAALRADTRQPHPGATHAIVVGMNYGGREPSGPIARYARGDDYHDVLRERLRELHRWLEAATGQSINARPYVDSAPILERDLAQQAGLGWFGKNTMLINPRIGSFFFLGSLFVEHELVPDAPFEVDRCGTCTRCLDACPTQAFTTPRVLDARMCISYLTIELREAIDEALRLRVGDHLYGCDVCQEVCPWNVRFATHLREPSFAPRAGLDTTDARQLSTQLLALSPNNFSAQFKNSAMKRAKRRGLARNAAVVLGNVGAIEDAASLEVAVGHDEPIVGEHAARALEHLHARFR